MKAYRGQLTALGKVMLVVLIANAASALMFEHLAPRIGLVLLATLYFVSLSAGRLLRLVNPQALAPGRVIEGRTRCLDLHVDQSSICRHSSLVWRLASDHFATAEHGQILPEPRRKTLTLLVRGIHRGRSRTAKANWQSTAPFGLILYRCQKTIPCDLWVLPIARQMQESVLEEMLTLRPKGLDLPQPTGPGEGEFYALREFRHGDSERRVHHRLSAKLGHKIYRVFRGEAPPRVILVLDQRVPLGGGVFERVDFEEAVRFAAGVLRALWLRTVPVELQFWSKDGIQTEVSWRCRDLETYLSALALARPEPTSQSPTPAPAPAAKVDDTRHVLIHLGMVNEAATGKPWIVIQAGSRRYYQLLKLQYHPQKVAANR